MCDVSVVGLCMCGYIANVCLVVIIMLLPHQYTLPHAKSLFYSVGVVVGVVVHFHVVSLYAIFAFQFTLLFAA